MPTISPKIELMARIIIVTISLIVTFSIILSINVSCRNKSFSKEDNKPKTIKLTPDELKKLSNNEPLSQSPAFYHNQLGAQYAQNKQYDKALQEYDKAIELEPDNSLHWSYKAHVYFLMGDILKAREIEMEASKMDPENPAIYNIISFFSKRLEDKQAEKYYHEKACNALKNLPKDAETYNNKYGSVFTLSGVRGSCWKVIKF